MVLTRSKEAAHKGWAYGVAGAASSRFRRVAAAREHLTNLTLKRKALSVLQGKRHWSKGEQAKAART